MRKNFPNCLDCGIGLKDGRSQRCNHCARSGSNNANWVGGLPSCLDCQIKLKDFRSIRCRDCNAKTASTVFKKGVVPYMKGKHHTEEAKEKNRQSTLGTRLSYETRLKMSLAQKELVTNGKHHFWKGGINSLNHSERQLQMKTVKYRWWRDQVFRRDNYTCQFCGITKTYLEADHIKPWSQYPSLRFNINNGRTLCKPCHSSTPTYAGNLLRKVVA